MARPCTFGIEEEYLLVDLVTGRVLAAPSPAVARCCRDVLGPWFAEEMFRSQVEVASPVFDTLHQACCFFTEQRQRLNQALAGEGPASTARGATRVPSGCASVHGIPRITVSCSTTTGWWPGAAC